MKQRHFVVRRFTHSAPARSLGNAMAIGSAWAQREGALGVLTLRFEIDAFGIHYASAACSLWAILLASARRPAENSAPSITRAARQALSPCIDDPVRSVITAQPSL